MNFLKFGSKSKKDKLFFRSLPWRSYLVFLAGIYFLFSTLGFVSSLLAPGAMSYGEIIRNSLLSGLVGAIYAHTFTRDLKFLAVGIILQFVLAFSPYGNLELIKDNPELVTYLRFHAVGIMLLVILGYILFVKFISGEGLKHFKYKTEIDLARKMHTILVPEIVYKNEEFDISGISKPVGEVGGDMADMFKLRDGKMVLTVADVSGHGVSAGLLMGMFKSALRSNLAHGDSLSECYSNLNSMIFDLKDKKMFLTASSISIHPGKMEFIVAGHLPLLIYRKGTKKIEELTIRQIPVGMKKDFEFLEGEFSLESGDFVVMVTDGVPETFSKSKELFSMERLKRIIEENAVEESGKLNQNILMEVEKFGIPDDDLTILTIKRN
jgi:hypothetical protein